MRKWTRCAVRAKWRRRAFTLTFLSLQGSGGSVGGKVERAERLSFRFCLPDGGGTLFSPGAETIVLRRADFHRLLEHALSAAPLRDYCVIRLPSKCGLRPGEARLLRWEQVDWDGLTLNVEDSKNYQTYPVPMDPVTVDYLRQLRAETPEKYVFAHDRTHAVWKQWQNCPLGYDMMGEIVKRWARSAGCQGWRKMNMYLLRHFFAASWAYPADGKPSGNLHALSRILRHKSLAYTQIYLSRLVFYEDLQGEYNRLQAGPFAPGACTSSFYADWCSRCVHDGVCRFMDQALSSSWANGCRHFSMKTVMEERTKNGKQAGSV